MSTTLLSCNTSSLVPFVPNANAPWEYPRAKHVFRRIGFGAAQTRLNLALISTPTTVVDNLIEAAIGSTPLAEPFWAYYAISDFTDFETENPTYIMDFRIQTGNHFISKDLKGRMIQFWTNHFVTELEAYFYAPYLYQYYKVCETNALGNFKDFVREVGITSAMLVYLNGFENTNFNPNENYARELFELFTMGEGNGYSQEDIVETSKALTGYNHWTEPGAPIYFDPITFYNGDKTIFGQTGNWGYDDVIDILFQERGDLIANFICRKIYKYFVGPDIDSMIETNIIEPLAQTFINNNFEIEPVLRQLLKSEHFFDDRALGVSIKGPIELIFQFVNETGFPYNDQLMEAFIYYAGILGQQMFDPPDVAGWQYDQDWISTSTLTGRWELFKVYLTLLLQNGAEENFRNLAKDLSNDSIDPVYITHVIVDFLHAKTLFTESDYDIAVDIFKWEIPQNYYDDGLWNLDWQEAPYQVYLLLVHIATMPEFQLK